jgi:oligoendopeptidase F
LDKIFKPDAGTSSMKQKNKKNDKNTPKKIIGEIWDLKPIMNGKSFDESMKNINSEVEKFKQYRDILTDKITPQKILEIIKLEEDISVSAARVDMYYSLKFYEDTKNPEALAKLGQLKQISAEISNAMIYFNLWFMNLDEKISKNLINSKELQNYKYHLELVRKAKPYTKNEEIEKIIQIKDITGGEAYAELYDLITSNYVFKWQGKDTSKEEVIKHFQGPDKKLREQAYEIVFEKYKAESTVLTEIYKDVVMNWCNEGIKIRGYKDSINIRNKSYDVEDKAVDALLKSIRKNAGIFAEYFRLKYNINKKAGQKYQYSRFHLYAPYITKSKKIYDYGYSKSYALETYKKFDQRFYDKAMKIFNERHVHSHPTQSKRGGAFCYSISKELTPYILLNHTDTLRDMFTIIHELGHGIHDLFASERQQDMERHASLTICETASIFSEMLMSDRMLHESTDDEEKKRILIQFLDNHWASITRQAYFVIFEKYAHEQIQKGVTKDVLDEYYYGLLKEQFGDMDIPEVFKHEWNYIPHIHESPFYCYSYAWGNLFVLSLFDMYKKEGKSFVDKYIELLSAGGSDSPSNLMKKLNANPESEEFWQRGFNIIKEEIEELKKLEK